MQFIGTVWLYSFTTGMSKLNECCLTHVVAAFNQVSDSRNFRGQLTS